MQHSQYRMSTYTHSMLGKPRHREDCDSVYSPGKGASQQACEHDTHSVPDHTRHRDNNESVYSAEKQHSQQAYELHMHTAPLAIQGTVLQGGAANMRMPAASLTTQGTEITMRVCTVLESSTANTQMSTYTHSVPDHTRHREDYDSVYSAEKQHSQQAHELHMHTAPLAIRGTVLQGSTANRRICTSMYTQYLWPYKAQRRP